MKIVVAMVTEIVRLLRKHGFRDNSITIQASLMKLGMGTGGYVLILHFICFRRHIKIMVGMVTEIVKTCNGRGLACCGQHLCLLN